MNAGIHTRIKVHRMADTDPESHIRLSILMIFHENSGFALYKQFILCLGFSAKAGQLGELHETQLCALYFYFFSINVPII